MAETDTTTPSVESSELEGIFTETQVLPVTAEEELKPPDGTEGTAEEQGTVEEERGRQPHTYQLEPSVVVTPRRISAAAERVLDEHLRDMEGYSAAEMRDAALRMSSALRDQVRALGLDRYRAVCQLSVGERCEQDACATFLCLWSPEFDHFATATYEGPGFFATAAVFLLYKQ